MADINRQIAELERDIFTAEMRASKVCMPDQTEIKRIAATAEGRLIKAMTKGMAPVLRAHVLSVTARALSRLKSRFEDERDVRHQVR